MSSILPSSSPPSQSSPLPDLYIVLGAGVIGLSTAITLKQRLSNAYIIIVAKNLPGDAAIDYTSPWAGANWLSTATDNGRQESWDAVTYKKFSEIVDNVPEAGVIRCELQALFDSEKEDSGVLSQGTGKIWYDTLVEGIRYLEREELKGAKWGMELQSYVVDVGTYLPW
jgi:D-amino-acid oxidase